MPSNSMPCVFYDEIVIRFFRSKMVLCKKIYVRWLVDRSYIPKYDPKIG